MAIAVDVSSPIRFAGSIPDGGSITSASFTPPANSVIVCCVSMDSLSSASTGVVLTVTGGSLTWTNRVTGASASFNGRNFIWTATQPSSVSMTVTVNLTNGDFANNRTSAKVYVVTGADTSSPAGNTGSGSSTTINFTPNVYTSSVDNSRGFGCATDSANSATLTSTDVSDFANYSGVISVISAYKLLDTTPSGSTVTLNFNAGASTQTTWAYAALEIKPASAGADQNLSPSSISSLEAFGTASVTAGDVNISPSSIASAEAFGTASISVGDVSISPSSITSTETFGTPTVVLEGGNIIPPSIASTETFGTLSITVDAVDISVTGIPSAEAFGLTRVTQGALPSPGAGGAIYDWIN